MDIYTEYQELVNCCVAGGMPTERASHHDLVMDWLGNTLQIAQSTRLLLHELRITETTIKAQAQQLAALQQELDELNKRCEKLEALL
jgi:hypothetical protein